MCAYSNWMHQDWLGDTQDPITSGMSSPLSGEIWHDTSFVP